MEKFGLFDLIDKFNGVANGKSEFNKKQPPSLEKAEDSAQGSKFINPLSPPPQHYLMNEKMLDFCTRHDNFAKKLKR